MSKKNKNNKNKKTNTINVDMEKTKKFNLKSNEKDLDNDDKKALKNDKKSKRKKKKNLKPVLYLIFFIAIMLGINFGLSYMKWQKLAFLVFNNEPSIIYNSDNEEIGKIGAYRKQENVTISDVPENLKDAFVSIEDQRYYTHYGIDIRRTGGAILNYFTKERSAFGGSSITQQLVKNVTGNDSNTLSRKVSEWIFALELETMLSKEEILEKYFNIIYLAPNVYGVKTSTTYYFDKDLKDLSLEECAFLAGINHTPNSYNPFGEKDNSEKIRKRTITVLAKMLELGYISEDEYNIAKTNTEKGLNFKKGTIKTDSSDIYSYHTDALIIELTNDLEEKYNIPERFANNILSLGNLKIYSTENDKIQSTLENEFSQEKYKLPATNEKNESSQAAMVVIDQSTGYVLGMTGGLGKKEVSRGFNRGTQAYRQTGSSIKPLSVLAPALSEHLITASSRFLDEETTFDDNSKEGYTPTNYKTYRGNISIRQALESSQNIPFVKIIEKLTPAKSIEYLKEFGITTLQKEDDNLSLALGGLSKGISPLEMAAAYATIANDGKYIEPTFYTKVTNNSDSNIIKSSQEKRTVLTKENAYILKDLLTEPVTSVHGTAQYCRISGMSVAAKTGTTNDNFDKWLCGFTPYYTAATWFGFDYNEPVDYDNKNPAGIIWANVMLKIHKGLESKEFIKPNSIKDYTVCSETGSLATTACPNTYIEHFTTDNYPEKCTTHNGNQIDIIENTTTSQKDYKITENTVIHVIDDIKATWEEIKADNGEKSPTNNLDSLQNKIEEKTTEIINKIN